MNQVYTRLPRIYDYPNAMAYERLAELHHMAAQGRLAKEAAGAQKAPSTGRVAFLRRIGEALRGTRGGQGAQCRVSG